MLVHKVEVVEEVLVKTVATLVMKTVVVDVFSVLVVVVVPVVPLVARVYPTTPLAKTAIISNSPTSEFFIQLEVGFYETINSRDKNSATEGSLK